MTTAPSSALSTLGSLALGVALVIAAFFLEGTLQIVAAAGGIGVLIGVAVSTVSARTRRQTATRRPR